MAQQLKPIEFNTFVGGLNTEGGPLTFPPNTSIEEKNFVLNRDGSRFRRPGMDVEDSYTTITSIPTPASLKDTVFHTFKWENAGGDNEKVLEVIQTGRKIEVFDTSSSPISGNSIYSYSFTGTGDYNLFSFTNIDGTLVVAAGLVDIYIFEFDTAAVSAPYITQTVKRLLVRDFFGVEDTYSGNDLRSGNGVTERPLTLSNNHTYNLRNQSWGVTRNEPNNSAKQYDPISEFERGGNFPPTGWVTQYPSNSDTVLEGLYPNPALTVDSFVDRFHASDGIKNPLGSGHAPVGFFIIDALERGISRNNNVDNLYIKYPKLLFPMTDLVDDTTPGGASVVGEYSGRAWFGGFSGEINDGDNKSPKMSSYILFSRLVDSLSDISECYQSGDPTGKDQADLLDTDGGFIKLDKAYGIKAIETVGKTLFVFADNGVWSVQGGSEEGFKATNYLVEKVTDHGILGAKSVVVVDGTIIYWGDNGIYHLSQDRVGFWKAENIIQTTIQSLYDNISLEDKKQSHGIFDSVAHKIRWVYQTNLENNEVTKELIFDTILKAFYKSEISNINTGQGRVVAPIKVEQFTTDFSSNSKRDDEVSEAMYLVVTSTTTNISYTFSTYKDLSFNDWVVLDGTGIDAEAILETGYIPEGDYQRDKQIPSITFHLKRTEDGFKDVGGVLIPTNQSSCIVQSKWNWTDSSEANKWSDEFQAYRYNRHYIPIDVNDPFDTGYSVISSKNRLKGIGKTLSLKFRSEEGKDLHLYGWSVFLGVNDYV